MTNQEFRKIADEMLVGAWGESHYPNAQLTRLWSMVQSIMPGDLRQAIDHLTMSATRPPSLAQIRSACLPAINRALEDTRRTRLSRMSDGPCTYCGGTGWVSAYRVEDPCVDLAFICSCEAAEIRGIRSGKGARHWRDASADTSLKIRRSDSQSTLEYHGHVRAWQDSLGLKPKTNALAEVR